MEINTQDSRQQRVRDLERNSPSPAYRESSVGTNSIRDKQWKKNNMRPRNQDWYLTTEIESLNQSRADKETTLMKTETKWC